MLRYAAGVIMPVAQRRQALAEVDALAAPQHLKSATTW
jgi:hypothetical protein